MFLDAYGTPKDVTAENLYGYQYNLHGVKLLTSADSEIYMPPRWHGTIYSTDEMLNRYRAKFQIDTSLLTFHAMEPFEPELICCERNVVEITVLPAGKTLFSSSDIVVFLVKIYEVNTLITKELGTDLDFFPTNHHYHVRIMNEGIDILYVDEKIFDSQSSASGMSYQCRCVHNLLKKLQPQSIKSLTGNPLPDYLKELCRKEDPLAVKSN